MIIKAQVPLRVSFGGGGTDISSFIEEDGGCVLTSTINKYAYCSIIPNGTKKINIYSSDFNKKVSINTNEYTYDGNLDIVKATLKFMNIKNGCDINIRCDVKPGTGLGASSAIVVSLLSALMKWEGIEMDRYELAKFAYEVERKELGISGGFQDAYATAFGGFNFIEFNKNKSVIVKPLNLKENVFYNLQNNLVLCYTGKSHISSNIIKDQVRNYEKKNTNVMDALFAIKSLAYKMRDVITEGNIDHLGEMLDAGWENKKKLSSMITNPKIDKLYNEALQSGALGGKLLGAGDGGYLLIYCSEKLKQKICKRLIRAGGEIENWKFEFEGVKVTCDEYSSNVELADDKYINHKISKSFECVGACL